MGRSGILSRGVGRSCPTPGAQVLQFWGCVNLGGIWPVHMKPVSDRVSFRNCRWEEPPPMLPQAKLCQGSGSSVSKAPGMEGLKVKASHFSMKGSVVNFLPQASRPPITQCHSGPLSATVSQRLLRE